MKCLFSFILGVFLTVSCAFAQEDSPDALIKKVTEEVLTIVRQDKEIQSGNARKAIELVEAKVLPHFNFQRMTALSMGREWNKASAEQKKRLAEEFKTLLVRTYSNALAGIGIRRFATNRPGCRKVMRMSLSGRKCSSPVTNPSSLTMR